MTKEKVGLIILKAHNKTRYIWFPIMLAMILLTGLVTLLAGAGLGETQKQMPNAFHGKYLNYDDLWLILGIWPIFSSGFIIITTLAMITYPTQKTELKDGITK